METCQSGLTYLFAKEAGASNPLASSNLAVSATLFNIGGVDEWFKSTVYKTVVP